jgi:hypothetical protein
MKNISGSILNDSREKNLFSFVEMIEILLFSMISWQWLCVPNGTTAWVHLFHMGQQLPV